MDYYTFISALLYENPVGTAGCHDFYVNRYDLGLVPSTTNIMARGVFFEKCTLTSFDIMKAE